MKDERRLCGNCKHEHGYGILRYSPDGVPLYGARRCKVELDEQAGTYQGYLCGCTQFVAAAEGEENLPALTQNQTKALWSQTSFLNAQVPAATRIAISGIMQLLEVGSTNLDPAIAGAAREFMGLMVSQITDIRSALTKDDNKFAHLVAHTDEIVEAMKGVVQLKERLDTIYATQERILERLDDLAKPARGVDENWNLPRPIDQENCSNCGHLYPLHERGKCLGRTYREAPDCECHEFISRVTIQEAARVFDSKSAPLWNEPITVEPDGE